MKELREKNGTYDQNASHCEQIKKVKSRSCRGDRSVSKMLDVPSQKPELEPQNRKKHQCSRAGYYPCTEGGGGFKVGLLGQDLMRDSI